SSHSFLVFSFFMVPHPPTSTLFPYTTLFRSKLSQFAFQIEPDPQTLEARRSRLKPEELWGYFVNGRLASQLRLLQLSIWLNGERSEEHTSELQSRENLVCRLLLEKKKKKKNT